MRIYTPVRKVREDLSGRVFGRLSVVRLLGSWMNRHYWLCLCRCGRSTEVATSTLKIGNTRSCGCLSREVTSSASTTHGMSKHPLYGTWMRMIQRCEDKGCTDYQYYGARGITVCVEWHNFPNFISDVGQRPVGGTIERCNNDKAYGPDNFRWATRHEQMQNTRGTRLITHNGTSRSISEWARHFNIKPRTLNARLNRLGYSFGDAITKEVRCGVMLNGKTWAENGGSNAE